MMDAPSAAFVIRSLARHSVRQAGSQAYRALVAAAAGARGGGSFPIHESRRASRMCIRRNSAIFLAPRRSAAFAFIAVCVAECGFWPQQIDILTEARALSCFPPLLPPRDPHSTSGESESESAPTAISLPVDRRVAASFLTLVLSPFDVDPPCQMQTLLAPLPFPLPPLLHLRSNESRAGGGNDPQASSEVTFDRNYDLTRPSPPPPRPVLHPR